MMKCRLKGSPRVGYETIHSRILRPPLWSNFLTRLVFFFLSKKRKRKRRTLFFWSNFLTRLVLSLLVLLSDVTQRKRKKKRLFFWSNFLRGFSCCFE